jgi:hypothetical protein
MEALVEYRYSDSMSDEEYDVWYSSLSAKEKKKWDKEVNDLTELCQEQMDGDEIIGFRD